MLYEPFEGPLAKIRWAHSRIEALEAALFAYAERVEYGFVETSKPDAELVELRFVFSEKPPLDIPLLIGDAIHSLRSCLDLMIFDIARARQIGDVSRLAFPFAKNESSLAKEVRERKIPRLGDDITKMVIELKPYASGNPLLSAVNELDIVDKHRMVVPVFAAVPFDQMEAGYISLGGAMYFRPGGTIVLARGTPFKMRRKGNVTAEFPYDSPLFRGGTVIDALNELAQLVQGIVETFQAHVAANPNKPSVTTIVGND